MKLSSLSIGDILRRAERRAETLAMKLPSLGIGDLPPSHPTIWRWLAKGIRDQPGAALVALLVSITLPVTSIFLVFLPLVVLFGLFVGFAFAAKVGGVLGLLIAVVSPVVALIVVAIYLIVMLVVAAYFAVNLFLPGAIAAAVVAIVTTALEPWWLRKVVGYRRLSHDERKKIAQRRLPGTAATTDAVGLLHPRRQQPDAGIPAEPGEVFDEATLEAQGTDTGALVRAAQQLGLSAVPPVLVDDNVLKPAAWTSARTIVISKGLIDANTGQAEVLAHELHHWSSCFTATTRFTLWGCGLPIYAAQVARSYLNPRHVFGLGVLIFTWPFGLLWDFIVVPVVLRRNREKEYAADAAGTDAFPKTYRSTLEKLRNFEPARSGWERSIRATHPPVELRIERVQSPYHEEDAAAAAEKKPSRGGIITFAICCGLSFLLYAAQTLAGIGLTFATFGGLPPIPIPSGLPFGLGGGTQSASPVVPPPTLPLPAYATPAPTLVPTLTAPTGAYPAQDTPFSQAGATLQRQWSPYGISTIPGQAVFDAMPGSVQVVNKTAGRMSDTKVRRWALADLRYDALLGWTMGHDQVQLWDRLVPPWRRSGDTSTLTDILTAGGTIDIAACSLYPTRIAVYAMTSQSSQYFASKGGGAADPAFTVEDYVGGCTSTVHYADGRTENDVASTERVLFAVHLVRDPVLGPYLSLDATGKCSDSDAPTGPCAGA